MYIIHQFLIFQRKHRTVRLFINLYQQPVCLTILRYQRINIPAFLQQTNNFHHLLLRLRILFLLIEHPSLKVEYTDIDFTTHGFGIFLHFYCLIQIIGDTVIKRRIEFVIIDTRQIIIVPCRHGSGQFITVFLYQFDGLMRIVNNRIKERLVFRMLIRQHGIFRRQYRIKVIRTRY